MPQKGKLLPEEKIRLVEQYLAGQFSLTDFQKEYGISERSFRDWVRLYQSEGPEALVPKVKEKKYSRELKSLVVEEYLSGSSSLQELCGRYRISDTHVVRKWIKKYTCHEELKAKGGGSEVYMTGGRKTTLEERIEIVGFCISNGKDYRATIEKYSVSYQQLYGWVRKYEEHGVEELTDHRGKRKGESAMTEVEKLYAELKLKEAENKRLQMENDLLKKLDEVERRRD